MLFRAHFQLSLTGTDRVYDLQKQCSSVAVIYGKDDIRQKVNVLCLQRYLRTDRLILLLTSDDEVLQHLCAPCWFVPMLPEKGGSLDHKSHPESLVVPHIQTQAEEKKDEGDNWACQHKCHPGCSAGLIVWGPHRDQMEIQEQDVLDRWQWWWQSCQTMLPGNHIRSQQEEVEINLIS